MEFMQMIRVVQEMAHFESVGPRDSTWTRNPVLLGLCRSCENGETDWAVLVSYVFNSKDVRKTAREVLTEVIQDFLDKAYADDKSRGRTRNRKVPYEPIRTIGRR